jgi:acyl carrier protein
MTLQDQIKTMLKNELMLEMSLEEIDSDAMLFGPTGIGLDSVDALQLVVALEKHFKLKVSDQTKAREILQSVNTIAKALKEEGLA